jgi:phenylpropionate dioxygenase-like ring-hydroxylating dioxygenase large terminal subunit
MPHVYDAVLFPGLFTSLQPDYLLTYRLVPLAASRTRIAFDVYFHPAAFVPAFDPRDVLEFWDRVNAEDKAICEDQQANASSRAFDPACYATVEEGTHAFDCMVAKAHLASAFVE